MSEVNPALLLHLPLDEMRNRILYDMTRARRNASAVGAAIEDDPDFGQCLKLNGGPDSHVVLPLLKLEPMSRGPFTFLMWVKITKQADLFDIGLGPGLQRLKVGFSGSVANPRFTVLMPTEREPSNGLSSAHTLINPEFVARPDGWTHVAMIWNPRGEGSVGFLLNGRPPTGISGTPARGTPAAPPIDPNNVGFDGYLGRPSFDGRMAHFRIYSRVLTNEQVVWDMEEDRPVRYRYRITHPLDFSLENRDTDPVLYMDNHPDGQKMTLRITPASRGEMLLGELPGQEAGPDNHHFELAFRPGTLAPGSLDKITITPPADGWKTGFRPWANPNDHDSLYLLRTIAGRIAEAGVTLQLEHLMPDARYGTRTTLVDFRYRNLKSGGGESISGNVEQKLDLITSLGRRNIPLHIGFAGSNQILNNASEPQVVKLRITNVSMGGTSAATLRFDDKSELILSVDQKTGTDWALDVPDKVGRIGVRYAKGRAAPNSPAALRGGGQPWSWTVPLKDLTIAPDETLELRLENVTASGANGDCNLYVDYRGVPGYWDGRVICVLEKTSIIDAGGKIGIGTASPGVELEVKGTLKADSLRIGAGSRNFTPLTLRAGWTPADDLTPKWYKDALGAVHLTGHCFYRLPQGLAEKQAWLNQAQIAMDMPWECQPATRTQLRFPGRVRLPISNQVPDWSGLLLLHAR